jgi:hypothetical protein
MSSVQPVLETQIRNPGEVPQITCQQSRVVFEGDAGYLQIHRANSDAERSERPESRGRLEIPGKHGHQTEKASSRCQPLCCHHFLFYISRRSNLCQTSPKYFFNSRNRSDGLFFGCDQPTFQSLAEGCAHREFPQVIGVEDEHGRITAQSALFARLRPMPTLPVRCQTRPTSRLLLSTGRSTGSPPAFARHAPGQIRDARRSLGRGSSHSSCHQDKPKRGNLKRSI